MDASYYRWMDRGSYSYRGRYGVGAGMGLTPRFHNFHSDYRDQHLYTCFLSICVPCVIMCQPYKLLGGSLQLC
uniref:Uncharacterized protein n=1 Tax=Picea glauca TaxID=3330 RepID=A0A101M390_PICGL|nr:hypothetical protein ABT39_MTgene89 [Picea glauca]KUM50251.1 hypothetical protein ABT39_MTgene94 [Picea glauca]